MNLENLIKYLKDIDQDQETILSGAICIVFSKNQNGILVKNLIDGQIPDKNTVLMVLSGLIEEIYEQRSPEFVKKPTHIINQTYH